MKKLSIILTIFFFIFELGAIILYISGEINTVLFILFTIISIGMIISQKLNKKNENNNNVE